MELAAVGFVEVKGKIKNKINVKGDGHECLTRVFPRG
jgi:hypothetical protein